MTGYLLDTGVFLLAFSAPEKLNRKVLEVLDEKKNDLYLSAASSWEIAIKYGLGKLKLVEPPSAYIPRRLASQNIRPLNITHVHGLTAGELPLHHQDPFDRMLIAQAVSERLVLITTDHLLSKYQVEILWGGN